MRRALRIAGAMALIAITSTSSPIDTCAARAVGESAGGGAGGGRPAAKGQALKE